MRKRIPAHASKMLSFNDKEKCAKGFLRMRQKCCILLARKNVQNIFCACFKNVVFYSWGKMRKMIPAHASKILSFIGEEKCAKWFLRMLQKICLLLARKNAQNDSCACFKNVVFYWRGIMRKMIPAHASKILSFIGEKKCAKWFLRMRQKCCLLLTWKNAQNDSCACFKNVVFYRQGKMRKMIPAHASKMSSFIGEEKCAKMFPFSTCKLRTNEVFIGSLALTMGALSVAVIFLKHKNKLFRQNVILR